MFSATNKEQSAVTRSGDESLANNAWGLSFSDPEIKLLLRVACDVTDFPPYCLNGKNLMKSIVHYGAALQI